MVNQGTAEIFYLDFEPDNPDDGRDDMTERNHKTGVVLHIDETLNADRRVSIEQAVETLKGVLAAHFTANRPHLMVVDYAPDMTSSFHILQNVSRQNVTAQLIGP